MPLIPSRVRAWLTKAAPIGSQLADTRGGWVNVIREPFTGAWQRNVSAQLCDVLSHPTVFACLTLIAGDLGKMRWELARDVGNDVWAPIENPAFSPVLRRPNQFQNPEQLRRQWGLSKLIHGNTYILKRRDQRGIVVGMNVLDPCRVKPLVAPDGSVFYECKVDNLALQFRETVTIPAREIIHDHFNELYHPLVGIGPLYAAGIPAMLGLKIQHSSTHFFGNGSTPGGILYVPGLLDQTKANDLKQRWEDAFTGANAGRTAVIPDGMKFEVVTQPADKSQLNEQWLAASQAIAVAFHVPWFMVGGPLPPYNNPQSQSVEYLARCLQPLIVSIENCLDDGLGLAPDRIDGVRYGVQFKISDLLLMDTLTLMQVLREGVSGGLLAPDEGRAQLNYGPVDGGDTPYLQQQNFSLAALARRDANPPPAPAAAPAPAVVDDGTDPVADVVDLAATFAPAFTRAYEGAHS